jgi:hypothetical protein
MVLSYKDGSCLRLLLKLQRWVMFKIVAKLQRWVMFKIVAKLQRWVMFKIVQSYKDGSCSKLCKVTKMDHVQKCAKLQRWIMFKIVLKFWAVCCFVRRAHASAIACAAMYFLSLHWVCLLPWVLVVVVLPEAFEGPGWGSGTPRSSVHPPLLLGQAWLLTSFLLSC